MLVMSGVSWEAATPILDRLAPLPASAERPSSFDPLVRAVPVAAGIGLLLVAWQAPIGASFRAWSATQLARLHLFPPRPWTAIDVVMIGASIAISTLAITVVHEIGHVVAGMSAGLRFYRLRVGPVQLDERLRASRYRGPGGWFGGAAALVPVRAHRLRPRAIAVVLGGSVANLLCAWLCFRLASPLTAPWGVFVGGSVIAALLNLLPYRRGPHVRDGWYLMKALQGGWAERWLALMRLDAEISSGTPPESWPMAFLTTATAFRDRSSATIRAHGLAHAAFDARGEWDLAARALEVCLAHSARLPRFQRDALISDAAVFQGRRRGRADLAQQWLAELSESPRLHAVRARAEAAVLHARGNYAGACAKLREAESSLRGIPNVMLREAALREAHTWIAELEEPDPRR